MSDLTKGIRTIFGSKTFKTPEKKLGAFEEYGYTSPDGDPVPEEYLCRITSKRNQATVVALLQESVSLHVESQWGPALSDMISSVANKIVEAGSGGRLSAVTRATSRRMWLGTQPITITLRLKFQAIKDAVREVVEPARLLQCMALPSGPRSGDEAEGKYGWISGIQKQIPFLAPPGPNPYSITDILNNQTITKSEQFKHLEGLIGGDQIMVEIGRFLTFSNVIVKSATPVFPIAFTPEGNPVRSEVSVTFQTYEMMTVEDLNDAYTKNSAINTDSLQAFYGYEK
jgi:hypothetical protein